MNKILASSLAAAALLSALPATQAITVYGLTTANQLIRFDSATPGVVTTIGTISQAGIVDIDFYPVNGLLYAFTATGAGYRLNLTNGAATLVITPGTGITGNVTDADFNPAADRVRLFSTGGTNQNYRLVPDVETNGSGATPGTVLIDGSFTDASASLVGSAYSNNFDAGAASATTLYSIDTTGDRLMIHTVGPQFNTINPVGTNLGVAIGTDVGFDIGQDGVAYLSNGNLLYTVNLSSGTATAAGTVNTTGLKSIAVLAVPEPGSALLLAGGLVGLLARRRRFSRA